MRIYFFPSIDFTKSKYRSSIFNENVASTSRWAINKVTNCTSFSNEGHITQGYPGCKCNILDFKAYKIAH